MNTKLIFGGSGGGEQMHSPPVENVPLHTAIRAQLLSRVSLDRAAPAIFLIAHVAFDPAALSAAAEVYAGADMLGAAILVRRLLEEARHREVAATPDEPRASAVYSAKAQSFRPLVPTERDRFADLLTNLSERIGMCAEITDGIRRSAFNDGVHAAQKEVEAMVSRLSQPRALSPAQSNQSQSIEERC